MIERKNRIERKSDEGASLIFAIFIITTIALVVGALLSQGSSSLRTTLAVRSVADSSYSAEGAAQIALNNMRVGTGFASNSNEAAFNNGTDGAGCFGNLVGLGGTDNLSLPSSFYTAYGSGGGNSAYVECTPEAGTGAQGSPVPISSSNKPGYAIVTLGGPLTVASGSSLSVHGGVYSNSNITGTVTLDAGNAYAVGTCSGTTVAAGATKSCSSSQSPIVDPNYSNELGGAVPTLQTPPTSCTSGVAVFQPGYYDDAASLTTATNLCSVAWFKPGTYYFDFHNNTCAGYCPSPLFGTNGSNYDLWTVSSGTTVIGGTPTDASGNVIAMPTTSPTLPGACQSPITSVNAVGVQFVFGGDSRMYLAGGSNAGAHMELCGTYHADRPPVVFYGLKSGAAPSLTTSSGLTPSGAVTTTGTTWTNATAAALTNTSAPIPTWTTTGNGTKNGSITVSGFTPTGNIPAGSILTGATLNVTHKEAGTATTATFQVVGSSGATSALSLPLRSATGADSITLNSTTNSTVFNNLQQQVHDNGYSGAKLVFNTKVTSNGSNTVTLDGLSISLTYYVPVLRGESGTCIQTGSGTGANACSYLLSLDPSGNNKIIIYLQGTTYAPYGDMNFTLSNFSAEVAKFGIVARQLEFAINNGNPRYTGPVFEIPDNSPGYGFNSTVVDLTVHLCPGLSTCSSSGTVALKARVQLYDPSGLPVAGQRGVNILSWSEQR